MSSRVQSMARSACCIAGRHRPRTPGSVTSSGRGRSPRPIRSIASRTAATAASVTSLRYRLPFDALRIGKVRVAQMSPASISPLASSTVTPHSRSPCCTAQSSADGPRSPSMPGCTTRQRCRRHTDSGMARFRKGATISSGRASATASSVTRSLTSSSSVRSWPSRASSAQSRCVRLLNAWLRMRTRISRSAAAARRRASRRCGGRRSACPSARSGADPRSPRR